MPFRWGQSTILPTFVKYINAKFIPCLLALWVAVLTAPSNADPIFGALVQKAADQEIPPLKREPYEQVTFDRPRYDTADVFDPECSCFVIPPGVRFAEFRWQIVWLKDREPGWMEYRLPWLWDDGERQTVIQRQAPDGTWQFFDGSPVENRTALMTTTTDTPVVSAILPVKEGERYALFAYHSADRPVSISGDTGTLFSILLF